MFTSFSVPLLLVLAGLVGLLLGLLFSILFGGDSKSNQKNTLPKKYADEGYAEAARLYYSPAAKKAITQLDGDYYSDFAVLTPEQKKRVLRLLQAWQTWSGQSPITVPEPVAVKTAAPAVAAEVHATIPTEQLPHVSPILDESAALDEPTSAKAQTIVEQINDVLEKILAASPDNKRSISLKDNGHDGVIVWVGLEKFNGVDEVPYPDVQKLIRAAVERWEAETEARNQAEAESRPK